MIIQQIKECHVLTDQEAVLELREVEGHGHGDPIASVSAEPKC